MTKPGFDRKRIPWRRIAPGAIVVLVPLIVGALIYKLVNSSSSAPRKNVPEVVQLRIIQPPPPPPPPPPPKQMEPPKMKQEVKMEMAKPSPRPDNAPPALDMKGQGPGDAFGLEGKPGGSDFLGGNGEGGNGSRYGWYAAMIQGRAQEMLQKQRRLLGFQYRVGVEVWLSAEGVPERVELINSTGNKEIDQLMKDALLRISKLPEPPPKDMPQPVVMQVSSS